LQHLDGLVDLKQQGAIHLILIAQIGIVLEKTDLHIGPGKPAAGLGMKQQRRRAFAYTVGQQMQSLQQQRVRLVQCGLWQTLAAQGLLAKQVQCACIQRVRLQPGQRHGIPMQPLFLEQEVRQRRTFQFLFGTAAAVVILALVAHRAGVGIDANLDQFLAVFGHQIHRHHDAQHIAHLVGDFFQQAGGIGNAHRLAPGHCTR
jgi:hypothetical protein